MNGTPLDDPSSNSVTSRKRSDRPVAVVSMHSCLVAEVVSTNVQMRYPKVGFAAAEIVWQPKVLMAYLAAQSVRWITALMASMAWWHSYSCCEGTWITPYRSLK